MNSATTNNSSEVPIFDWTLLKTNLVDIETIKSIIRAFAMDCTDKIATLEATVQQNQWPEVCKQLHTFKGACATMTAQPMFTIVQQLEILAQRQAEQEVAAGLERLKNEHQRILALIDAPDGFAALDS